MAACLVVPLQASHNSNPGVLPWRAPKVHPTGRGGCNALNPSVAVVVWGNSKLNPVLAMHPFRAKRQRCTGQC